MTFRTKLLVVSALTSAGAVALATGAVSLAARRAFDRIDQERRKALLNQFERELDSQSKKVEDAVRKAAASEPVMRMALESERRGPDFAAHLDDARQQAEAVSLDFLDIVQRDTTVISSAHSPARFGYRNEWLLSPADMNSSRAFLTRVPLPDGSAVALAAVFRPAPGNVYVVGARNVNSSFLSALGAAPGVRALLWLASGEMMDANGPFAEPQKLAALLEQVKGAQRESTATIRWTEDAASEESFVARPLVHGGTLLGALLVGTSLRDQVALERSILATGLGVAAGGILLGVLIGWWTTARVTRPIAQLVAGVQNVAHGDLNTRVAVSSSDEIGQLAQAFNRMTGQLIEQREKTLQAERVAAWRELARRLAHELKNPLFPLQITIENLQKARGQHPDQFDEVFRESTATLLGELQNLKLIVGQFSDFAKMPKPEIELVDINSIVRDVLRLFDAQFNASPKIDLALDLTQDDARVAGDPLLLSRALRNLVLNAMDAMPQGGRLRIRTARLDERVFVEIADSGQGLTEEECARLFTPYYTTKIHGTGLGLAIVQSVVSDHHGRIAVSGEPGRGATFTIELPARSGS